MNPMRRALCILALLFAPLLVPLLALAAILPTGVGLELGMTPQYPHPGDTINLLVNNTSGDADTATYSWSVDVSAVLSGVGEKRLTVTAPDLGKQSVIDVTVTDPSGISQGSLSATIAPATIDLVWEGKTSVPPFYIGRPLPNGASAATVLAVPHIVVGGAEVPASSLVYTWQVNGVPKANASGYGKSSLTITPPNFGSAFSVSVHAETADARGAADGTTTITPQSPRALIYENAPLLGIRFEKVIAGSFPLTEQEASFTAFPLFIANPDALAYQWTLDSAPFSIDPSRPRYVTFRTVGTGSGSHAVTFSFTNPSGFLEAGQASFTLTF